MGLSSVCSCAVWSVSHLIENPEDKFPHDDDAYVNIKVKQLNLCYFVLLFVYVQ